MNLQVAGFGKERLVLSRRTHLGVVLQIRVLFIKPYYIGDPKRDPDLENNSSMKSCGPKYHRMKGFMGPKTLR